MQEFAAIIKEIQTEIVINVAPERVWSVLTDFDNYEKWNPFIRSLKGSVEVGNAINVKIQPAGSKPMEFRPKVLTYVSGKELSWLGKLFFSGLFDGLHRFELIDNRNGTTTFRQSEKFSGILVAILNLDNTKKGFEAMNQRLKEIAERP